MWKRILDRNVWKCTPIKAGSRPDVLSEENLKTGGTF